MIIFYLRMPNGGFGSIAEAGLWAQENLWADTTPADRDEIREYLRS